MLLLYEIKLRKLTETDINYRFPFQLLIKYIFFNKNSIIISKNIQCIHPNYYISHTQKCMIEKTENPIKIMN